MLPPHVHFFWNIIQRIKRFNCITTGLIKYKPPIVEINVIRKILYVHLSAGIKIRNEKYSYA